MSLDLYLGFWIYILAWHAEWCSGLYWITIGSLLVSLSLLMGTTIGVCLVTSLVCLQKHSKLTRVLVGGNISMMPTFAKDREGGHTQQPSRSYNT